jgi:phosphotransacetylase
MGAPIHVLQRGSTVDEIVNLAIIAVVDAQERARAATRMGGSAQP